MIAVVFAEWGGRNSQLDVQRVDDDVDELGLGLAGDSAHDRLVETGVCLGQELALISVKELHERIALLREEIARLEADIHKKQASRNLADQFFKK